MNLRHRTRAALLVRSLLVTLVLAIFSISAHGQAWLGPVILDMQTHLM